MAARQQREPVPSSDAADMFSLTSAYTPVNRENLAAFVSVDADVGRGLLRES